MNYEKPFDTSVTTGRFQSLHVGHEQLFRHAISISDRPLILVGSSQESGTLRNPFSVTTRIDCIKEVFGDSVIIRALPDMTGEDDITPEWGRWVLKHVKQALLKLPEIMIYGNDEARSKWFDPNDIANIAELIINRNKLPISGTQQRLMLLTNNIDEWHKYTPVKMHKFYGRLRDELMAVPAYREIFDKMLIRAPLSSWKDQEIDKPSMVEILYNEALKSSVIK